MIKLNRAVIVEGRYDKITLENIIDAPIFTTEGFGIFKDPQKRELIAALARKNGIVILTDSDHAGAQIRAYIKSFCRDGDIVQVYVPTLKGKEARKTKPGKQGILGVEGMKPDVILKAFERSGILAQDAPPKQKTITKTDLYCLGLSGTAGAAQRRAALCDYLRLPHRMSTNAFLDAVNALYTDTSFREEVAKWQREYGSDSN